MTNRRMLFGERLQEHGLGQPTESEDHYLWQIVDEGVLGASRHVELTLRMFADGLDAVAREGDAATGLLRLRLAGETIERTRGRDAPVVGNVIAWLLQGLGGQPTDRQTALLRERVESWNVAAVKRRATIRTLGADRLGPSARVLAFDYSSTVAEIVLELHRRGHLARLVIPESRCIAGGRRYLEQFLAAGIDAEYVVDMAIDYAIERSDVLLLGVESLGCDGSFLNTVGSRIFAERCRASGRQVFGVTDLFKLDRRTYAAGSHAPRIRGFDELLLVDVKVPAGISVTTTSPELEVVPPAACDGFITERGFVPPAAVWALGRELFGSGLDSPTAGDSEEEK